jgi:peptidoglycan-N-acetylglucosamine deacetylase
MGDPPLTPYSPGAMKARLAATRRRRARRRAAAGVAGVLLIAAAVGVLFTQVSGGGVATRGGRRLEASVQPEPPRRPSSATVRATAARELLVHENEAIDRLLRRQPFITAGGTQRREIALTFDDGPGPYTPRLLNELDRLHVPATFFEIGFMFRWFHASATRELHMGDAIGDHTETHPPMALLSPSAQRAQILGQTEWVRKYGGPFPRLWRPPYGSYNATTLQILHRLHMLMVLWTVDTDDYLRPGVATIVHRALAGARAGAIILMHDAGGDRTQTIAALPLIVRALRARGYRLVTIPKLILDDSPLHRQRLPSHLAGD